MTFQLQPTLDHKEKTHRQRGARGKGKKGANYRKDTFFQPGSFNNYTKLQRESEIQELKSFSTRKEDFDFTPGFYPVLFDEPIKEDVTALDFAADLRDTMTLIDEVAGAIRGVDGDLLSNEFVVSAFLGLAQQSITASDGIKEPRHPALSKIIDLRVMFPSYVTAISSVIGNFKTKDGDFSLKDPSCYAARFTVCFIYAISLSHDKELWHQVNATNIWNKFRRLQYKDGKVFYKDLDYYDPIDIELALATIRSEVIDANYLRTDCFTVPRITSPCKSLDDILKRVLCKPNCFDFYGDRLTSDMLMRLLPPLLEVDPFCCNQDEVEKGNARLDLVDATFGFVLDSCIVLYLSIKPIVNHRLSPLAPSKLVPTSSGTSPIGEFIELKLPSRIGLNSEELQSPVLSPGIVLRQFLRCATFEQRVLELRLNIVRLYLPNMLCIRAQPEISIT